MNKTLITTCFLILSGYSYFSLGNEINTNVAQTQNLITQPHSEDYPAPPIYKGKPAKLSLDSELAKTFRTRLTAALSQDPFYAGEYVRTGWGCGSSGCYYEVLLNKRTGKVLETTFSAYSVQDTISGDDIRVGEWIGTANIDSRLLTTTEVQESNDGKSFISFTKFYLINNGKLELIKMVQDQ
ncbi:hypothetical protein D3C84_653740 [compost metagenome]|jgi:hypothetical protein